MRTSTTYLLSCVVALVLTCCQQRNSNIELDANSARLLEEFVASISVDPLGELKPEINTEVLSDSVVHIGISFHVSNPIKQDDWRVHIKPAFQPTLQWAPHLTPTDDHIIAQHVFRAPAMIVTDSWRQLVILPDVDLIKTNSPPWYMDLDAKRNILTIGAAENKVPSHVLFTRDTGMVVSPPRFDFGFYIMISKNKHDIADPWRKPLAFMWEKWGKPLYDQGEPIAGDLQPYVKHTYNWAFNTWKKHVWQEFTLNGTKVGAPVFIVNVTQSPNYPGDVSEREFRSVWNQAWFSSLRSAQGVYRYARRTGDKELMRKANMTKELALSFPQDEGLFPAVIGTEMERVEVNGKTVSRSKGWNRFYFGNSNRNPVHPWNGADIAPYHILDMSWTAYLMITWHDELEKDERLVNYARKYADRLLTLQQSDGFFPAWLDTKTLQPLDWLNASPESSMSVTFLLKLYEETGDTRYRDAAARAMDAIITSVVPARQWEDFETYWSCSRVLDSLVGQRVARNNTFKQNTLSMYWTAEALLNFYLLTGEKKYLEIGQQVLDELLMYQATWQPWFIPIHALGGFGVMNADGEWNDSRQSLFAELIIRYGEALSMPEYRERGIAALRSSFVMMYCPENPETMEQWTKIYPYFNEQDYGFMMENYGHGGKTNSEGLGIGEFTIYDWGNGAAAEAYNRIADHYGSAIFEKE